MLSWGADCGSGETYGVYRGDLAQGYGESQAETDPLVGSFAESSQGKLGQVLAIGKVVQGHQFQRSRPEDANAIQRTPIDQHSAETIVVGCCRDEATATGKEAHA